MTTVVLLLLISGQTPVDDAVNRLFQEYGVEEWIEHLGVHSWVSSLNSHEAPRQDVLHVVDVNLGFFGELPTLRRQSLNGLTLGFGIQEFRLPSLTWGLDSAKSQLRERVRQILRRSIETGNPLSQLQLRKATMLLWQEVKDDRLIHRARNSPEWPKPEWGSRLESTVPFCGEEAHLRWVSSVGIWFVKLGVSLGLSLGTSEWVWGASAEDNDFFKIGGIFGAELSAPLFLTHTEDWIWVEPFVRMEDFSGQGLVTSVGLRGSWGNANIF